MYSLQKKHPVLATILFLSFYFQTPLARSAVEIKNQNPSAKNSIKTEFNAKYAMVAASFNEGPDDAQFVQLIFNPNVKISFNKYFSFKADASLNLVSARQQTRFDSPGLNTINPNEILFSINPNEKFELSFGAINQKHLGALMLAQSGLAFIGAIGRYTHTFKNLTLTLKAQYTIPSSISLESDRTGEEEVPAFQTEGFEALWTPTSWINFKANVNHFSYSDLPSVVAFQSGRFGNEVIGATTSESFFLYEFDGFSQSYLLDLDFNRGLNPFIGLKSVDNLKAPSGRERSQFLSLGLNWKLKNMIITPMVTSFYTESDAAPAVYTDARYGRNNRKGQFYGLKFDFKKLGLSIATTYVTSGLIEPDPIQNNVKYFEVYMEVANFKF